MSVELAVKLNDQAQLEPQRQTTYFREPSPEPIYLEGGDTGVLLFHGFTSTPYEFQPMSEFLHRQGFTVYAPLLAGHGTSPEEMEMTTYLDWVRSAMEAYEQLSRRCVKIYLGGLSMGGAMALHIAAHRPVDGVFSMCAPLYSSSFMARLMNLVARIKRFQRKTLIRPDYIQRYLIGYDRTPLRSAASLLDFLKIVKSDLKKVKAPALIMQSDRDETVRPANGDYIFRHVGSEMKLLRRYPKSGHILTVDVEKDEVFAEILTFLQETS